MVCVVISTLYCINFKIVENVLYCTQILVLVFFTLYIFVLHPIALSPPGRVSGTDSLEGALQRPRVRRLQLRQDQ